jgi:hypothetical protein
LSDAEHQSVFLADRDRHYGAADALDQAIGARERRA